jgi:hypothetical protein
MKNLMMGAVLCASLAACGDGNPFTGAGTSTGGGDDTDVNAAGIPAVLAQDLESFTYNPDNQTLTIRGVTAEDSPFEASYVRKPALDRGGYQAYTQQDGSLDRHSTAFVKDIDGTRAGIAATGGQFTFFFVGGAYGNSSYSAPVDPGSNLQGGLVQYAGNYVGVVNTAGSGEDLLPVAPGTETSFLPGQVAEITGRILVTASFSDSSVAGTITERVIEDAEANGFAPLAVPDIQLAPTDIALDGTFLGEVKQVGEEKGTYGGIFGGTGATEVAGVLTVEDHDLGGVADIENGVFVLGACGTAAQDPVCNQPVP